MHTETTKATAMESLNGLKLRHVQDKTDEREVGCFLTVKPKTAIKPPEFQKPLKKKKS